VEQKVFTEADRTDRLLRAISGDDGEAVIVHQDAHVFVSRLHPGSEVVHELGAGRGVYLYVIEGDADVLGERMTTGDAAEIWDESSLSVLANALTELIAVDVALGSP
jgi:redox-sensitive bicupin YhaK (pirin superfamily)